MDMQIEDPGITPETASTQGTFNIPQPESEYVLGQHGELRRRYPKHMPTTKTSKRRHHKAK